MKNAIKALFFVTVFAASGFSQEDANTAYLPFIVNVGATVRAQPYGEGTSGLASEMQVTANTKNVLVLTLSGASSVKTQNQRQLSVPVITNNRGTVNLQLPSQSYQNAEISLYSINGRRVLRDRAAASEASKSISRPNLVAGVYLLSVNGTNGSAFTTRLTHSGGAMNVNVAFNPSFAPQMAKAAEAENWTIRVWANGYTDTTYTISLTAGENPTQNITLRTATHASFTETVNGVSFDMVYVPGGTFTLGCDRSSGCPANTTPVSGVSVSNYYIGKTEVSRVLWNAVMGTTGGFGTSHTSHTWYDAFVFACKLSQLTGKKYRMTTEAEWEYAAKNHLSSLEQIGSGEEWAYNSWNDTHTGGTDPIGPGGHIHNQKTRRDARGTGDEQGHITGRLIRSIDGTGPALRLAISAEMDYPPNYVPPCDIHAPEMGDEPVNSYRDMRWVTGSDARWTVGALAIGSFNLRVWEDGTATMAAGFGGGTTTGQWFTSNNISFVFVPSSGSSSPTRFAYIFLDETQGTLISDKSFMSGGFIGRIIKEPASNAAKPAVANLMSGEELARARGADFDTYYKMVDMVNIPQSARQQDSRLLDGTNEGWFQDNRTAGGLHHYRKDVELDEFRFTVNQGGSRTMLANGNWFTVNNTFLRVTHPGSGNNPRPYAVDYLYTVVDGTFYHNSFMAYERGDFRMFTKTPNGDPVFAQTCGDICSGEIPKGQGASLYATRADGHSTFVPAPCPPGGC
jgi:formylglycine-generating enzyme required for sulfatase activity